MTGDFFVGLEFSRKEISFRNVKKNMMSIEIL